tara:strand:- start:69 stop:245 length:177 start_codon:yes stop_codon:yes gene_type:complete
MNDNDLKKYIKLYRSLFQDAKIAGEKDFINFTTKVNIHLTGSQRQVIMMQIIDFLNNK